MKRYRAAIVGCGRMGAFIDYEARGSKSIVLPYSHAAGFEACPRTELVAGSGSRKDVMEAFGKRYGIAPAHCYADWREMIVKERPDILSIATQPEQRAEIALFAIEQGVPALYLEKALCASLEETRQLAEAAERRHVVVNMGTNRRWHPGFDAARELIASGQLGALKTLIIYNGGTLFNMTSHWFDLLLRLNGDVPATWVHAHLPDAQTQFHGDEVIADPAAQGVVAFENGVMGHVLLSPRDAEVEMICERAYIEARGNGSRFELFRQETRDGEKAFFPAAFPAYPAASPVLRLIEDLVQALDTGKPTRGGIKVASANMELIFGFIESHRRGGQRVAMPVESGLKFVRRGFKSHTVRMA